MRIVALPLPLSVFPINFCFFMTSYSRTIFAVLFAVGLCVATLPAQAQRTDGALGVGAQAGAPTGVSLKFYNSEGASYDFLGAWDARDSFFLFNVHAQFHTVRDVENLEEGELEWFVGPGAFIGVFGDDPGDDDFGQGEAAIGPSGRLGLNYAFEEYFEVFAQVTPRVSIVPDTDLIVGGGIGLRIYP